MQKLKVYVKYCRQNYELGGEWSREVSSVATMDTILKTDVPKNLSPAKKYIYSRLQYYKSLLARYEKERVEMKASLKQLGPFRNSVFEKEYRKTRTYCKQIAQTIKRYKQIFHNDWETVKTYLHEKKDIEYQEYEIEIPDSLLGDK